MSCIDNNDWLSILVRVVDDRVTLAKWFIEQIVQKQKELGKETVNLTASAIIVAREMGFDVQSW